MSSSTSSHKHRLVIDLCNETNEEEVKLEKKRSYFPDSKTEEKHEKYWHGITKLTPYRTPDQAKLSDTIQFQSILQPHGLKKALLSAMVIDWPWLLAHIPVSVPLTVITDWDRSRQKAGYYPMPTRMNGSVIHPPFHKNIYGKMHAKLMLLFYKDSLRVVISSANLVAYDYNLIQNIVFLQDFPLRLSHANATVTQSSPFLDEIKRMLVAMTVPAAALCELDLYDYAKARARIVSSIPGDYQCDGNDALLGMAHLQAQIDDLTKELHMDTSLVQNWCLEYQCSSLGASKKSWLKDFISATSRALSTCCPPTTQEGLESRLRIIFPSLHMVTSSRAGPNGFLTVFLNKKHYQDADFPKQSLCQSFGQHDVISLHTKILSLWLTLKSGDTLPLFNYFGSHNFSAAAWGTYSFAFGQSKRLFIRNFEIGVLVPGLSIDPVTQCLHPHSFPYSYQRPPPLYTPDDVPWMQNAQ